jgi:dTDP-4-amino-4,6-dideoxygalactose transaminase
LGFSQLERLDDYIARRHALAERYSRLLSGLPVITPWQDPLHQSALHLYPILLADKETRLRVFVALREAGIGVNVHYIPVHMQPDYQRRGFAAGQFPASEAYYARTISLPLFPMLTEAEQDTVVGELRRVLL